MNAKIQCQVHKERLCLEEKIPLATPLVVYLEPSGYCNLKCKFCPQGLERNALKKDFMPVDLFAKLLKDVSNFTHRIKLLRICGNGEPLLNKHLIQILQCAREYNVFERIELLTNGVLLTPDLIKNLPCFLDRIIFSIEGLSPEEYERFCSTRVDFGKLLDSLKALFISKGKCIVHAKIHHEAVSSPEKEETFLNLFGPWCDEIFIEKLVPMWPQLGSELSSEQFRWGNMKVIPRRVCAQIFKGVQVQANGEVVPCCVDWKRRNVLGDIRNRSLYDIWHGPQLQRLQMEHLVGNKGRLEPCRDCSMNDYCEIDNMDSTAQECAKRIDLGRIG